ncbi:MAG: MFS transporter [Rhodococcus sp. (in: high G+C Gram-positive bacteria)]
MTSVDTTRAGRREWMGLVVLVMPIVLVSMDMSVLYLALPSLTRDLGPSSAQQLWILDIYSFMLAGLLVTMGSLGDRIGTRRLLIIGSFIFGVASVAAAFSHTPEALIASRVLLGIGGATLAPSTLSLLRKLFVDPVQRGVAIGVWTAGFAGGGSFGPVIAGALLEYFWWGSVFLINLPIMVVLLIAAPLILPEAKNPDPGRFDLPAVGASILAMLGIVYALKHAAQSGLDWQVAAALGTGLAVGWWFVRRTRASSHPVIDFDLFRVPAFSVGVLVLLVSVFVVTGFSLMLAQYLQLVLGLSTLHAGLWSLIPAIATAGASLSAPLVMKRRPPAVIMTGAVSVMLLGVTTIAFVAVPSDVGSATTLAVLLTGMVIAAVGVGTGTTFGSDRVLATAAPEKAGAAGAISETGAELGGALGVAVLGSISVATYRLVLGPADMSGDGTLAGTLAEAGRLPSDLGAGLAGRAREAYVDGIASAAGATMLILIVAGGVIALLFRRAR